MFRRSTRSDMASICNIRTNGGFITTQNKFCREKLSAQKEWKFVKNLYKPKKHMTDSCRELLSFPFSKDLAHNRKRIATSFKKVLTIIVLQGNPKIIETC